MKERWFNYRPICLIFAFLLLGTLFAFYCMSQFVFSLSIAIVAFVLLLVLAIYKKKVQYFLLPLLAFMVGIGSYWLSINSFNSQIDYVPTTIDARIYEISSVENSKIRVEADHCLFEGKDASSNLVIYIYDNSGLFEGIEVGANISFNPINFYHSDLFYYDTPNTNLFSSNTKYTATVNINYLTINGVEKTPAESIKEKIHDNLSLGLSNENVDIAYSALFGEKNLLSDTQYSAYRLSGVAHLLAVSGLHVGIIVSILCFVLKLLRVKGWARFGIVAIVLMAYLYLCNYIVSALRASIMALVLLLSDLVHRDYDSFNAISLAGIVVFIINPLCIFDVGFLMSFSCAFGIALLYKPIKKALIKMKIQKTIAESLAISISTVTILIFIMAYFFHTFNVISLLSNVILIPIFTIGFIAVFVCSFISLLIPVVTYLLYPINYIFNFISLISIVLGNLSISNFTTIGFNFIVVILYFVFLLIISRLCTARYSYKVLSTLPIISLILIGCLI